MVERGAHAIRAVRTVRGRFLGDDNQVFVIALYIAGRAASEDVVRLFDAIAEGKVDLRELLNHVKGYLKKVEVKRDEDEKARREADAASHASIFAAAAKGEGADPDAGVDHAEVGHEGVQVAGAAKLANGPR